MRLSPREDVLAFASGNETPQVMKRLSASYVINYVHSLSYYFEYPLIT